MPLDHFRIDDRLVHGQVVVGWGQPLELGFLVLVDDTVAANDWERELYRMGTPPEMVLFVETVPSALARLAEFDARPDAGMLLTVDIETMDRFVSAAPQVRTVTVGGVHHRAGRTPCLPYVFFTDEEAAHLRALRDRGVDVVAQDVPSSRPVPLEELLAARAQ